MNGDARGGLETSQREDESRPKPNGDRCQTCGDPIAAIVSHGPGKHVIRPCGHDVGPLTARDLAVDQEAWDSSAPLMVDESGLECGEPSYECSQCGASYFSEKAASGCCRTLIVDGGERAPHLADEGLWIPRQFRDFDTQIVVRTPRVTIQHFGTPLDPYYGPINETHFGPEETFNSSQNPEVAPNSVSIKPQGKDAEVFELDLPQHGEIPADGGDAQ